MIFYSWTALKANDRDAPGAGGLRAAGLPVAKGLTDDRGRAMKAGEEILLSGRAAVVVIEAVRPAMAGPTLAPCYVHRGVEWRGRCAAGGEVAWDRFFLRADPGDQPVPGRMGA